MAPRKAGTDQEQSGVVSDRPTKRARVEDEHALHSEDEDHRAPQAAPQASDLYLDTARRSYSISSARILMRIFADKSRQIRL